MTLLQTVPEGVNLVELEDELIRVARDQYQTDINVHNLHVWKLSGPGLKIFPRKKKFCLILPAGKTLLISIKTIFYPK